MYNGSLHQKGSVKLGNAYVASLEQSGFLSFLGFILIGYKVYKADATNASAEALPPLALLFIKIDEACRN